MARLEINIINPKADKLLRDLADMDLITIKEIGVKRSVKKVRTKFITKSKAPVNNDFLAYLTSWPQISEEELANIEAKRNLLNQWK